MAVFLFHEKQETLTLNIPRQASYSQPIHTPQTLTLGASMAVYVSPGGTWYPSVYSLKWWIRASMDSYNDVNTPECLLKNSTGKASTSNLLSGRDLLSFQIFWVARFLHHLFWLRLAASCSSTGVESKESKEVMRVLHRPKARFKPTPTVRRNFPALHADYTYTVFSCNSGWFL